METLQNQLNVYEYADYMLLEENLAHFTTEGSISFQSEVPPQDLHTNVEKLDDCVIL